MRSFFVKETVPYLRTQRSFFSTKFLESKNFVESCMCSWCDVLFRFSLRSLGSVFVLPNFTSQGVGGRVSPFFGVRLQTNTLQHPPLVCNLFEKFLPTPKPLIRRGGQEHFPKLQTKESVNNIKDELNLIYIYIFLYLFGIYIY